MFKIVGTTLAAAALLVTAAHAGSDMIRKDVPVAFADLDLSTEGGARELLTRVQAAAAEACGGSPLFYSTYSVAPALAKHEFNTCRTNAISAAVKALPFPTVQKLVASADSPLRVAGK